jgi:NitT/TauT family transport system substrate-binding protein
MRRCLWRFSLLLLGCLAALPGLAFGLDKIHVAQSSISGSQAILWVTQDAGFFKKNELDTSIIFVAGGPVVVKAMLAGDVPFGIMSGPGAVAANIEGADIAVLMSFVSTMEHVIFSLPTITKPADLRGKKIAVSRFDSSDDFGARFALRKWGLEPIRDVAILQIGGQPSRYSALQAKVVDATPLQPPITVTARKGGFFELASLAEIGLDYFGTSLITTRSYIKGHEDVARRFVKAMIEGIHFYKTNKQASLKSIAKFMKLNDADALEETYNQYALKFMQRAPYPTVKGLETIIAEMAKVNPKAKAAAARSYVEPRFVKELEDSGYLSRLYAEKR